MKDHSALRYRLQRYDSSEVTRRQALFAAPRELALRCHEVSMVLRLGASGTGRCDDPIRVTAGAHEFLLDVHHAPHAPAVGARDWRDFADDAQIIAWSIAHELLLDALCAAFECTVSAQARDAYALDAQGIDNRIDFVLSDSDGCTLFSGTLGLPDDLACHWVARSTPVDAVSARDRWSDLPVPLWLCFEGPNIAAATLIACVPGDIIVLGTRAVLLQSLRVQSDAGEPLPYACAVESDTVCVVDRPCQPSLLEQERAIMSEPTVDRTTHTHTEGAAADAGQADATTKIADQIPVRLVIQAGSAQMMLCDLPRLQPGFVLPLNVPVEGTNVSVLANGVRVGEGELVATGDKLGVCITRWGPNGL